MTRAANVASSTIPTWTTATRPSNPTAGQMGYNTTTGLPEWYDSATSDWVKFSGTPAYPYTVEYLVVAGGGGGSIGGGGGGGGYRSSVSGESSGRGASAESVLTVGSGISYTVTVGAAGTGAYPGTNGGNSVFGSITSLGGGGGGTGAGLSGGCGGGARGDNQSSDVGGAGTTGQGYNGGDAPANATFQAGGGGGGAGSVGGTSSGSTPGAGGSGVSSSITGSAVTRSQGGGGCTLSSTEVYASPTGAGSANTGRGGGAGRNSGIGFNGGSGIVIIRYAGDQRGTGGTVTSSGGYTIHTFTSSGTYTA